MHVTFNSNVYYKTHTHTHTRTYVLPHIQSVHTLIVVGSCILQAQCSRSVDEASEHCWRQIRHDCSVSFAGYVTAFVQLYCVSFHCFSLHVSAYMAIFKCVGYFYFHMSNRLLVGKPEGKRPLGRPRRSRWTILKWIF
jgi:hypothetical protein